jgi:small membrane protein
MIIRILMLAGLAAIGYLVFLRRNRLPIHIVTVFIILGAGALAVLFPEDTDVIANYVGVGRGVDLIMYLFEVAAIFVLIHYYTKFVELQRQLTTLTRELAILKADLERATATERRDSDA